jgi:hypothetical protein
MENKIGSGTTQGLLEFLDSLIEKGRATSGSITPLKTAVRQIISTVDGKDKWQDTDIRNINVQDYIERFSNLTLGKYHQDSLKTYKTRLGKAVTWYTKFLIEPGWTPPKSQNANISKSIAEDQPKHTTEKQVHKVSAELEKEATSAEKENSDLIAYPFPLRPGKLVRLYLPLDLTAVEAKRLGSYLETLSIDYGSSTPDTE